MSSLPVVRVLDASLNRAGEGLRVVEDYVRFALEDAHLTGMTKQLRHDLAAAAGALSLPDRHAARQTQEDVGTTISTASELQREGAWDVCRASLERVKQSLRSLEEYSKVQSPAAAAQFEALRYRLYTLEAALGRTLDAVERLASVRLYVLIDGRESAASFASLVDQLLVAGVDAIQLRDKQLNDQELIARAEILRRLVQGRVMPGGCAAEGGERLSALETGPRAEPGAVTRPLLIINDRPDIAAIVDADGVHLGQDDMSVKDARKVVGPRKLIGVSTHSLAQARAAVLDGANYIGVGPTFPSPTKSFDAFPGIELLRQVAREIRLPAFAIGGITSKNLHEVLATGVRRVAASSAIAESSSPQSAATEFLKKLGAFPEDAG